MIDPVAKEVWCEALRSGEFIKGEGELRQTAWSKRGKNNRAYCCLGVLCEIFPGLENQSGFRLDLEVMELVGIVQDETDQLIFMNDGIHRLTFNQIADWIEEHL